MPSSPTSPASRSTLAALASVLALSGCAAGRAAPAPAPAEAAAATQPPAVHWVRASAEHRALFEQVYDQALDAVTREAAVRVPGRWAVILDADETVLDNSEYQRRLAARGASFSPETWNAWVREEAAPALPGAVAFADSVRSLGGKVAIVTNRDQAVCEPTRRNLDALGVSPDVVLCRAAGEEGKEGRFRAVLEGTASPDLPGLAVVAWLGDNIHDFPGMSQDAVAAGADLSPFGERYFLLPNPMYGSWERLPPR